MASVTTDRRRGINSGASIKLPCIAASTGNLTLEAEQTVDGIALVTDDRVFCKDQTDAKENGIYTVDTSSWKRSPDFDGRYDVVEGTIIPVSRGTTNADTYWRVTNIGTIVIGTTELTLSVTTVLDSAILRDGSVKMIADFEPNSDVTYSLGSAILQWVNGFFSGQITTETIAVETITVGGTVYTTKGVDIASANDMILLSDGNYNDVTGTVQINGMTDGVLNETRKFHFDSAVPLKHNTAASGGFSSLWLPSEVHYTTSANDEIEFTYDGALWRVTGYSFDVKRHIKDHGSKSGDYTLQLDESELHLIEFSATATLTIASRLTNDKATVVIKNGNNVITLAGINNNSPTLTQAASVQDFVGLVKSFGKISAVAVKLNIATT